MKYFPNITDPAEAQARYYALSKKYHTDNGGDGEKFKEMQQEYEDWKALYRHGVFNQKPPKPKAAPKPPKPATAKPAKIQRAAAQPTPQDQIQQRFTEGALEVVDWFFDELLGKRR